MTRLSCRGYFLVEQRFNIALFEDGLFYLHWCGLQRPV
jgi:hypothetical protein